MVIQPASDFILSALVWSLPLALALLVPAYIFGRIERAQSAFVMHNANRVYLGLALFGTLALSLYFGLTPKSWQIGLEISSSPFVEGSEGHGASPPLEQRIFPIGYLGVAVWFGIASVLLVRLIIAARQVRALIARTEAHTRHSSASGDVLFTPEVKEPVTVGVLRPRVLMPEDAIKALTADQIAAIIAHERAHLARFDHWKNCVLQISRALFWFNPPLRHLIARYERSREFDCDRRAIQSGVEPAELGRALGHFALAPQSMASGLALGGHYGNLAQRIRVLSKSRTSQTGLTVIVFALILLTCAALSWAFAEVMTRTFDVGITCDLASLTSGQIA